MIFMPTPGTVSRYRVSSMFSVARVLPLISLSTWIFKSRSIALGLEWVFRTMSIFARV